MEKRKIIPLVFLLAFGANSIAQDALLTRISGETLTFETADQVTSYKNTCESVATFFMASIMRHDEVWKEVASEQDFDELETMINERYSKIKINKFQVKDQELIGGDSLWLTVFMELEYNGECLSGTDQMTLRYEERHWKVSKLPS